MAASIQGEWTDEELREIDSCVRSEAAGQNGLSRFVEHDEWLVLSVSRRKGSNSIVDVQLSRIADQKRINFELHADDRVEEWGNSSKLTDQVFWLTIILMEYEGIFGIDQLDDDFTVKLVPRRSVYDFKPPWYVAPVVDPNVSHGFWSPLHFPTPIDSDFSPMDEELEAVSLIRTTLQLLNGLQVRSLGHQVRMLMIGFGGVTMRPIGVGPKMGEIRKESDYHLHISSGWEVRLNQEAVFDYRTEGLYGDDGRPTAKSIAVLDSLIGADRVVESVSVTNTGNIDFNLTGNASIHILRSSEDGEEWRIWATNRADEHFVIEIPDEGPREGLLTMSGDLLN
jgi:hypothetical protein